MAKKPNKAYPTWGGSRLRAGRKVLDMDPQTRKYYNAYNMQRLHAKYRGLDWHFTFQSWLDWWGDDINQRGRGAGKLVMARYNDIGPYHPDNVRKCLHCDNNTEGHLNKGKSVATPAGAFDTLTLASKHFGITVEAVRYRIKTRPHEYYYI